MADIINASDEEYKSLYKTVKDAKDKILYLTNNTPLSLFGEIYLSSEEVVQRYKISQRALQRYRTNNAVPHTSIAGKILYPMSGIEKILEKNYRDK